VVGVEVWIQSSEGPAREWKVRLTGWTDGVGVASMPIRNRMEPEWALSPRWSVHVRVASSSELRRDFSGPPKPGDVLDVEVPALQPLDVELRREDGTTLESPADVALEIVGRTAPRGTPVLHRIRVPAGRGTFLHDLRRDRAVVRAITHDASWQSVADVPVDLAPVRERETLVVPMRRYPELRARVLDADGAPIEEQGFRVILMVPITGGAGVGMHARQVLTDATGVLHAYLPGLEERLPGRYGRVERMQPELVRPDFVDLGDLSQAAVDGVLDLGDVVVAPQR
jgi:hypothetical protein